MPELPEILTLSNYLNSILSNHYIKNLKVLEKSRYYDKELPGSNYYRDYCKIAQVTSRGKKIIFVLETPSKQYIYLISFLGMEGCWTFEPTNHTSLSMDIILIKDNIETFQFNLYFCDTRHFGLINIVSNDAEYNSVFKDTGPDLLRENITFEIYKNELKKPRKKNKQIGIFMLEQESFSGIGNYLRSEILFHCKINPYRTLESLSDIEIQSIYNSMYVILKESYSKGGLTISTYKLPNNQLGEYKPLIYGRNQTDEGYTVTKEKMKDTRSIHYVKNIQI